MIYFVSFLISSMFIYLGVKNNSTDKYRENRGVKKAEGLLIVVGLLIPIFLATFRDPVIGTDTDYYAVPFFNEALQSKWLVGFLSAENGKDIGYLALNYFVSRFTNDIGWIFFLSEAIIIGFVFASCWQYREVVSPALSMLFFYFILYNMTLSTIRQCIAMSICFFAISYAISHKFDNLLFPLCCIWVAFFFHSTALFSFLIVFLYKYIYCKKLEIYKMIGVSVVVALFLRLFTQKFISLVVKVAGIFGSSYGKNDTVFGANNIGASGYKTMIILGMITLILNYYLVKKEQRVKSAVPINRMFFATNLIYIVFMIFAANIVFVPRMMYYIQIMWCIPLANSKHLFKKGNNRFVGTCGLLLMVVLVWLYFYIISNVHETYPYIFR